MVGNLINLVEADLLSFDEVSLCYHGVDNLINLVEADFVNFVEVDGIALAEVNLIKFDFKLCFIFFYQLDR